MLTARPPILIGGAGEKKTLRLVARYADACNIAVYDPAQAAHKLEVLREHCATEGRDYSAIEKTAQTRFDLGENGENVQRTIESLHEVAELGFTVAHGSLLGVSKNRQFDLFAERISPRWKSSAARPRPPRTWSMRNSVHVSARCGRA